MLQMKQFLILQEQFCKNHPLPQSISKKTNILKLMFLQKNLYTNSQKNLQLLYPLQQSGKTNQQEVLLKADSQKQILSQSNSFKSISHKKNHEKVIQDDVFGKAYRSKNGNRWVYIAVKVVKQSKSYFLGGEGKASYKPDFGECYSDINNVGIFVWDVPLQKIFEVDIDGSLIPGSPSFMNQAGTQIMFQAFTRKQYTFSIKDVYNHQISIFTTALTKSTEQQATKFDFTTSLLVKYKNRTNISPIISKTNKYIIYYSGSGISHAFYLDLVILKKTEDGWKEKHRIKDFVIGYCDTLKMFAAIKEEVQIVYFQSVCCGVRQIYEVQLESGKYCKIGVQQTGFSYQIRNVEEDGFVMGILLTPNYRTFFYGYSPELKIIEPSIKQNFTIKQIENPVHGFIVYADQKDLIQSKKEIKQRPAIMIIHGGPHSYINPSLSLWRYTLLKMGYVLLMPNISGSMGQGPQKLTKALKRIGQLDVSQILSFLEQSFKEFPFIDKNKVHLFGNSYGGFLTIILSSKHYQKFRCGVIMNAVHDLLGNMWFSDIPQWAVVECLQKQDFMNLTKEQIKKVHSHSASNYVPNIPILQFLGQKDRTAPFRQGLFHHTKTKSHQKLITTYVYPDSNHQFINTFQAEVDFVSKSIQFYLQK